jgi:hypothetical protein
MEKLGEMDVQDGCPYGIRSKVVLFCCDCFDAHQERGGNPFGFSFLH